MPDHGQLLIDDVDRITALDSDPVLRNLLITQCYHDLSLGLSWFLGEEDLNWCNFATWASRTAGRFIRDEEVPLALRAEIENSQVYKRTKKQLAERQGAISGGIDLGSMLNLPESIAGDVSEQITLGNLKVFSELAPLFARMIREFGRDGGPNPARLEAIVSTLAEGPTRTGGQSLLRSACMHYFEAIGEEDPKKKAERILLANGEVGLHEQIRLQPHIAASLDAPVAVTMEEVAYAPLRLLPGAVKREAEAIIERLIHPIVDEMERVWQQAATKILMTLKVPGQTLSLGGALPPPSDGPLYPDMLETIEHEELRELMEQYGAFHLNGSDEGISDWARLSDRMKYIFRLFRSRQKVHNLFEQPFADDQLAAILAGQVPTGDLG
jgi:hypothetical protein